MYVHMCVHVHLCACICACGWMCLYALYRCICVNVCLCGFVCVWWICVGLSGFFIKLNLGKCSLSWGVGNGLYRVSQFLGVWNRSLGLAWATYWVTDQAKLKSKTHFYSLKKFRVALGSFLFISWEAAWPRSHWSLRWFRVQASDYMFPTTVHHDNGC